jgi:hypothetical protein
MAKEVIIKVLDDDELKPQFSQDGNVYRATLPSPYENMGELIRCKDCKSYQPRYSEGNAMLGCCQNLNSNFVTGMGYCYWAERKEE